MKNKKTILAIAGVIVLILVTIGLTYAYWQITKTQTGENKITTACLNISLEGTNDITLTNQYPLSDEEGTTLTPYTFTVTNNCATAVDYQIALESIGDSTTSISQGAIKVMLDSNAAALLNTKISVTPTISGAYSSHQLFIGTLKAAGSTSSSATHELRLWIDENAPVSEINKTFASKISVTIGQGIEGNPFEEGTLAASILSYAIDNNQYFESEPTNFAAEIANNEYGLYKAEDNEGDSYYFRGDPQTNYVQFGSWAEDSDFEALAGDSMYWKIIRINGDGTIRLAYVGFTKEHLNHSDDIDGFYIGYSIYNSEYSSVDFAGNDLDLVLSEWYNNNLQTKYASYISDSGFCNDSNLGEDGYYAGFTRIANSQPTLKCNNVLTNANGLSSPVGLITADEYLMATGANGASSYFGDDAGSGWWTMTPASYSDENGYSVFKIYMTTLESDAIESGVYVRPVINIKADVAFTGSGTYDSPYIITTD